MPRLAVQGLSATALVDGTPLGPGEAYVPVLVIVDAAGKPAFQVGSTVTLADISGPALAVVGATQAPASYGIAPSGTLSDDAPAALTVYHVAAAAPSVLTAANLAAIVAAHAADPDAAYAAALVDPYVAGAPLALGDLGLTVEALWDAGLGAFRAIGAGDTVVSHVLAVDAAGNRSAAAFDFGLVADYTPPTVPGTLAASAGPTAASQIVVTGLAGIADGTGAGVSSVTVKYGTSSDIALATSQSVTPGANSVTLTGLAEYTLYYIWATATDAAGNASAAVPIATGGGSLRTADVTAPTGLGTVTAVPGLV